MFFEHRSGARNLAPGGALFATPRGSIFKANAPRRWCEESSHHLRGAFSFATHCPVVRAKNVRVPPANLPAPLRGALADRFRLTLKIAKHKLGSKYQRSVYETRFHGIGMCCSSDWGHRFPVRASRT